MVSQLSPRPANASVREGVDQLVDALGEAVVVDACVALLAGADPEQDAEVAVRLSGHENSVADLREAGWRDYWWRTWGARGLLYAWTDRAASAVVDGIGDEHWRPAEMCLKVAALREIAEAADAAARLCTHEMPRVRATALRLLGRVGDTEHVEAARAALGDPEVDVRRAAELALRRLEERLDLPSGRVL